MTNVTQARPYAKAAFEYALQKNELAQWQACLQALAVTTAIPEWCFWVNDPRTTPDQVFVLLKEVFASQLDDARANFVHLLVENERVLLLSAVSQLFDELLAEHNRQLMVKVISAFPLNQMLQDKLKAALQKRLGVTVQLACEVDKTLLGGAIIHAGDAVIDGSVRSKLSQISETMIA